MSETLLRNDLIDVTRYTGPEQFFGGKRDRYQITDRLTGAIVTLSAEQWESIRAALGAEHPRI
jgi:hypothetical protein